MKTVLVIWAFSNLFLIVRCQRPPPGVNPQHYQQQQYQVPQQQYQQVPQQQYQQVPQQQYQQVPQQQQFQQVPQQQFQQMPVQQVPVQQAPVQQQQQVPQAQAPHHHAPHGQQHLLNVQNLEHEKEHLAEHLHVQVDTSKMSEQELQFHYFKMHDSDNNNKLDGCELIKSLIHWHVEEKKDKEEKIGEIYSDDHLQSLVDNLLKMADKNYDGFVDWMEFKQYQ
ncbi:uncharacterized protein LOC143195079 isoform X2 [Rhynchophorus ferrugineus]|uniref:uncharacterized protein LOC143195079 isoform X2 n=1 Tax=Rhynchophorus ferrugineus TaxID=354439 RepID=UPI003FCECC51